MPEKELEKGLVLAFLPRVEGEAGIRSFELYLHHGLEGGLAAEVHLRNSGLPVIEGTFACQPHDTVRIGELPFDALNEAPLFSFGLRSADGKSTHRLELKVRPKSFFKKLAGCSWLHSQAYLYLLMAAWPPAEAAGKEEWKKLGHNWAKRTSRARHERLLEKARMQDFIDLHAEKLFKSTRGKSSHEILEAQLKSFEAFLDKAVFHGLDRIYIVHGHGKGRLRREVHLILEEYPHVLAYNVNYNPRFGMGATEVILK